jgi:phosphatidate cytidylyltransferase
LNNFFRRTLTGAFIVLFVLGGFWLHPVSLVITGFILALGTQYEYYVMVRKEGIRPQLVAGMTAGAITYFLAAGVAAGILNVMFFLVLIPVFFLVMIMELYRKLDKPFDSMAHTIFGVFYTVLPFSLIPFSAFSNEGIGSLISSDLTNFSPGIIVGFFILLWANDSGAYLIGVAFGKHRLMERISPKKSWEGFFGGVLLSGIAAWLISGWLGILTPFLWIMVSLIIAISGTFGDLIESMLKRSIGVKDSGNIMPGHGGFLDRFDSTLISFPLVFLFITLFG